MQKIERTRRVGLLGFGVVGAGVYRVLMRNQEEIARRVGHALVVTQVSARDRHKLASQVDDSVRIVDDPYRMVADPDIDIIVEAIGGDGIAHELVRAALDNGKPVVTANKALLAGHGSALFQLARTRSVALAFEAAVAGGIPIIKVLREGLAANRIHGLAGIINGTTNFILTQMRERRISFDDALGQAQRLGYAEQDPSFDIDGVDAAHKLSLLAAIAFGVPVQFDKAHVEGIRGLQACDVAYAQELGYRIKLLGITRLRHHPSGEPAGIELRVHPTLIPDKNLLANVEGPMNAVLVQADAVGSTLYYGQGAGAEPTASAVVADLVDVARLLDAPAEYRVPSLGFQNHALSDTPILPIEDVESANYLRIRVADRPGAVAEVARVFAAHGISIGAMIQRESQHSQNGELNSDSPSALAVAAEGDPQTDIIFLTHASLERAMQNAVREIEALQSVRAAVLRLRLDALSN